MSETDASAQPGQACAPILLGVRHSELERFARESVLDGVYQNSDWMQDVVRHPPEAYVRHIRVRPEDRSTAVASWALHQRWKLVAGRIRSFPAQARNMQYCVPAGMLIKVAPWITCKEFRICPWCHQRRLIKFFENLPEAGDTGYASLSGFFVSDVSARPTDMELLHLSDFLSRLARKTGNLDMRILKGLTCETANGCAKWGVKFTAVIVGLKADVTCIRQLNSERSLTWK